MGIEDILLAKLNTLQATVEETLRRLPKSPSATSAPLLSIKEAAAYLGRTPYSSQHLIADKAIPVVRVGRRVHLHRKDLDEWIEGNKY